MLDEVRVECSAITNSPTQGFTINGKERAQDEKSKREREKLLVIISLPATLFHALFDLFLTNLSWSLKQATNRALNVYEL